MVWQDTEFGPTREGCRPETPAELSRRGCDTLVAQIPRTPRLWHIEWKIVLESEALISAYWLLDVPVARYLLVLTPSPFGVGMSALSLSCY